MAATTAPATAATRPPRTYKYLDLLMAAFVVVLLCSNLIGAGKVATLWGFTLGAGVFFFPLSYFLNDVLTEVYGYARSRRIVWAGFAALAFMSLMCFAVTAMPPAPGWPHQGAYEVVFGQAPRIVLASLLAFSVGEFTNSFVLAKMKVLTQGKHLWARTIGSTAVGEAVDSAIFYPVAFMGLWAPELLISVMLTNYALKVGWEVVATPLTYKFVAALKKAESEDYFDTDTDFTPFSIKAA
jgi:uncharacterized integral membrane protein (TIGR00697 family)